MDAEEFLLDTPVVRSFVADVRAAIAAAESPEAAWLDTAEALEA